MIDGRDALREFDSAIATGRRTLEVAIRATEARAHQLAELQAREARAYRALAEIRLFVAKSDPVRAKLTNVERRALDLIAEHGDATPVTWLHRSGRYVEKLATPDVSVADLVGDVDPIKAATLRLPYSDERVIHFGLIPRSHRSIFVINDFRPGLLIFFLNLLYQDHFF